MRIRPVFALLCTLGLSGCLFANVNMASLFGAHALQEIRVTGDSGPKLVMLGIEGVISESRPRVTLGGEPPNLVARVREALDRASEDSKVAGLLLRIRSPGGTVSASESIHHEIERWKQQNHKPVVAYLQGLATSGGYYVAMAADEVIAHPTTVTGSIGVIMRGLNVSGLMTRWGIQDQSLKSGAFKDAASPLRPMREEERVQLQSVIDELYGRFLEVVAKGRPDLDPDKIHALADGRVYTAKQALERGLIDGIGHLEDAIGAAEKRAGISESRVIAYRTSDQFVDNIYGRPPGPSGPVINLDIVSLSRRFGAAGFYYMWPLAWE